MTARRQPSPAKPAAQRTREYRARQRAKGLKLVQFWVPDVNDPAFIAECRRQALAVANSPHEAEDQAFIDAVRDTDWGGWEE